MQSLQKKLLITLLIGGLGTTVFSQSSTSNRSDETNRAAEVDHADSFTLAEQHAAARLSEHVSTSEWLGPLAPVALSPFFGITCLSGMAIFGEGWLPADHFLTRASTPLKNPAVFYSFLTLTVLTSLPRLSKVSKPFAQAVDQLEAYAGIITLLAVRYLGNLSTGESSSEVATVVYQAGVFEFTAESLIWIATAANVIVINGVKFFFEILVWITPIPTLDAIFEAGNKLVCLGLMSIYAFSPTLATILNLSILFVCLLVFQWTRRRVTYYRTILFEFLSNWFSGSKPQKNELIVFPKATVHRIPALAKCYLVKTDNGWRIECRRWLRPALIVEPTSDTAIVFAAGFLKNTIRIEPDHTFFFGRKYNRAFDELVAMFQGEVCESSIDARRTSAKEIQASIKAALLG